MANEFGYAAVYDLTILLQAQRQVVPEAEVVLSMFYPPVFLPLFQLLAQLPIFLQLLALASAQSCRLCRLSLLFSATDALIS